MSELASYKGANAGDGWSPVGGQTINVYVRQHENQAETWTHETQAPHASPGSSSSGNGVALAAGFCPLSIGTETGGSSLTIRAVDEAELWGRWVNHAALSAVKPLRSQTDDRSAVPQRSCPICAVLRHTWSDGEGRVELGHCTRRHGGSGPRRQNQSVLLRLRK